MKKLSDEFLLSKLYNLSINLGRVPRSTDMGNGRITYHRRFGSWNSALKLAGLSINRVRSAPSVVGVLSEVERAYIAACIDTDGCIMRGSRGYITGAGIANNSKEFLENIQEMCGGAGRLVVKKKRNPKWQLNYDLRFRKWEAHDILLQIVDYLVIKKNKAWEFLKQVKQEDGRTTVEEVSNNAE
jgi:hypothetical protein